MQKSNPDRLLIFVIAYYAESTLRKVLERIPRSIFTDFDTEILVVDDASTDRTFAIGREYKAAHADISMTVLRNQFNQGYGGNQKVGYAFALAEGFDFVAMLHGDGQYAPEALPSLMAPFAERQVSAVFGSRMVNPRDALKGGMPLYKFVGNRVLTTLQNALLGSHLSEFHSGYRIYRTKALRRLPFELNSNAFHFDTEIIIQLLNAKERIVELPIPTYYGNEICRVNGMKYAKDVMLATLRNCAHRSGLLYQRRFDAQSVGNEHYDLKLGYKSSHTMALDTVPQGSRVLDIGGGPGGVASLLQGKGCRITLVDQFAPKTTGTDNVLVQDLDTALTFDVRNIDIILLLDVIEHLRDPEEFLRNLRNKFDFSPPTLILTTPNVAFIIQRLMLLFGQFNYGKAGILDRTHKRLFTFRSIKRLLKDEGFLISVVQGVPAPFPKVLGNGFLGKIAMFVNEVLMRLSKTLFAYQIFIVAQGLPSVDFVLHHAKTQNEEEPTGEVDLV